MNEQREFINKILKENRQYRKDINQLVKYSKRLIKENYKLKKDLRHWKKNGKG